MMRMVLVVVVGLGLGCRRNTSREADAGPCTGCECPGAVCDAGDVDASGPDPATSAAFSAIEFGVSAAAAVGAPIVTEAEMLRDDLRLRDDREGATRERIERAVSGNSVVTPETCAMFSWMGLSATVALDMCTLEATGTPIDGSVTAGIRFAPTEVVLGASELTIGDVSIDGEVGIRVGGQCVAGDPACMNCRDTDPTCMEMRMPQQTLFATLTLGFPAEMVMLTLDDVTAAQTPSGVDLDGSGSIMTTGISGTFVATGVRWDPMVCHPSGGTIVFTPTGGSPVTFEFLPTTPTTGDVRVTLPPFPPVTRMLLSPCMPAMPKP